MGWETVEVEHDEFVTKKSEEKVLICDGCGMETEKNSRVRFHAKTHDIDNLHVCYNCIDGDVPLSAHSPEANPTVTERVLYSLEDDVGLFFTIFFWGLLVGANVGWFL